MFNLHDGHLLPLGALTHLRDGVPVVPLPPDCVIENGVHDVPDFCLAAIR